MTAALSRRRFLTGTGITAAGTAVVATACRGGGGGEGAGHGVSGPPGDLDTAARMAGLERLTVATYTALRGLAVEGRLGAVVPPAVTEFVTTATGRHEQHLDAWNRLLVAGGRGEVTAADAALKPRVEAVVSRLVDIPGLATLALRIEDHTSQTYLQAIPTLTSPEVIRTAAQILVVDQQHQAFLRYVLGLHPLGSGTVKEARDFAPADPQSSLAGW